MTIEDRKKLQQAIVKECNKEEQVDRLAQLGAVGALEISEAADVEVKNISGYVYALINTICDYYNKIIDKAVNSLVDEPL